MNRVNLSRASLLLAALTVIACGQESTLESQQESSLGTRKDAVSQFKALILSRTVEGGEQSPEYQAARKMGLAVTLASDTEWAGMTAAQFATYRVIILGDANCASEDVVSAALANRHVWSRVVNGNILIAGTAPVANGAAVVTEKAVRFAAYEAGLTGLYVSLSCYYQNAPPNTRVALLDGFGDFMVQGGACHASAHIVAEHPVLNASVTDHTMSNWPCSVNAQFNSFPMANFAPWAIATYPVASLGAHGNGAREFVDGTFGAPYILARGVNLVGCGNYEQEVGEECDYGYESNGLSGSECSATCQLNWCGNGVVDPGEDCDEGAANGQGTCPRSCRLIAAPPPPPPPANRPPVARCRPVVLSAGPSCGGVGSSINDDSYDPDNNLVSCVQSVQSFEVGSTQATLTCTDAEGLVASCSAPVKVVDDSAPVISCPAPSTFECGVAQATVPPAQAHDNCVAPFVTHTLEGDGYTVGTPRTVRWLASDGANEATCSTSITMVDTLAPTVSLVGAASLSIQAGSVFVDPGATATDACSGPLAVAKEGSVNTAVPGNYTLTYSAQDAVGLSASVSRTVTVQGSQSCSSISVKPAQEIWPPNHKMWSFNLSECAAVVNPCGAPVDIDAVGTITSIYSDEVEDAQGKGDGHTLQDIVITGNSTFQLRAERQGKGNGRVYGVNFQVTDSSGAVQTATCKFVVPHDQSGRGAIDDGAAAGYTVTR
jgi:hypothetical protein